MKELGLESHMMSTDQAKAKYNDADADDEPAYFTADDGDESSANPIGDLLELATKLSLRPPVFAFGNEEGPPHNRLFTCHATFRDAKTAGRARTKQLAKRNAALKLLKAFNHSASSHAKEVTRKEPKAEADNDGSELTSALKKDTSKNGGDSFALLKTSVNKSARQLLDNRSPLSSAENTVSFLDTFKQLCLEENFSFKFWEVPSVKEGAYSIRFGVCRLISLTILQNSLKLGMNRVILQLRTSPITVFIGTGNGIDASMQEAACQALEYIQILCSRR